jgi:hypothetical protein
VTSTVDEVTRLAVTSTSYGRFSTTVGVTAILLLGVLLIEKEFLRTSTRSWSRKSLQALDIAIFPLLLSFFVIMLMRFVIDILHR